MVVDAAPAAGCSEADCCALGAGVVSSRGVEELLLGAPGVAQARKLSRQGRGAGNGLERKRTHRGRRGEEKRE